VEPSLLALQHDKKAASTFEAKQSLLGREIFPFASDPADDYRTARSVWRFMAAELILRGAVTVQIDGASIIIWTSGPNVAFHFP
jgi:hypothetical protein